MTSEIVAHGPCRAFNLHQWVEYIQRQHWRTMDMTLERITKVWNILEGKKCGYNIIVAGTNGKGSTIKILESIFLNSGKITGAYTSPHLVRFNERIRVNGIEVPDNEICDAFFVVDLAAKGIPLTYFEYATLCALVIFQAKSVDICLLEVGMGGRLDAVNMIDGDMAVITSIGIDHEAWLGHDRETIAREKAGIIRKRMPVVCSDRDVPKSLVKVAEDKEASLFKLGRDFEILSENGSYFWYGKDRAFPHAWSRIGPITEPTSGYHQFDNLAGAIATLALSSEQTDINPSGVIPGVADFLPSARCQIIEHAPLVVLDVAHNYNSACRLASFLDQHPVKGKSLAVFGVLRDKTLNSLLEPLIAYIDHWILAGLEGERGQSSSELLARTEKLLDSSIITCCDSPKSAYLAARDKADVYDRVVIFGSFYVAGDILYLLKNRKC